jgi:hypothetical protein
MLYTTLKQTFSWMLMAHTYPIYSGGRDQEDGGGLQFEASLGKQFTRPYLEKNPSQKRAGGVTRCRP